MKLTQSHINEVQNAVDQLGLSETKMFSQLCDQWFLFTRIWVKRFDEGAEEYIEWLNWRVLIQMVLDSIGPELADHIAETVYVQDKAFMRATTPIAGCLVSKDGDLNETEVMLFRRIPKKLMDGLRSDLKDEGLV